MPVMIILEEEYRASWLKLDAYGLFERWLLLISAG
jgi:hypothetical protein